MHYELLPTYSAAIDVCFMHAAFGKSFITVLNRVSCCISALRIRYVSVFLDTLLW